MSEGHDQTGAMLTSDSVRLAYREWLVAKPRAALVLSHGLGEHSGRYAHLAARLNALGIAVRAHDLRGHGKSQGKRGALQHHDDFLDDQKLILDDFAHQTGMTPFLFGHSLGGLIAARFASARLSPIRGLILSSPALGFSMSGSQKILQAVASVLAPNLTVSNKLDTDRLSHDAAVVAAYRSDPLVHDRVTPRLVKFMHTAIEETTHDATRIEVPVLLQIAGSDRLVDAQASREWFARLPAGQGLMHWYDDAYHEIYNENTQRRGKVLLDLSNWLDAQLSS